MSWNYRITHDGITVSVQSDTSCGYAEVACIPLRDPQMIDAIRNRDPRVFAMLAALLEEIDEISYSNRVYDEYDLDVLKQTRTEDEYEAILRLVVASKYASDRAKELVGRSLQRLIDRRAKKKITKQRRRQFQQSRPDLELALIDRDGYSCNACQSADDLTIDHIVPLSRGGTDQLDNLRFLCRSCNSVKGDRTQAQRSSDS